MAISSIYNRIKYISILGIILLSTSVFAQNTSNNNDSNKDLYLGLLFSTKGFQSIVHKLISSYATSSNQTNDERVVKINIPKQSTSQHIVPTKDENNAGLLEGIEQLTGIKVTDGFDITINTDEMVSEFKMGAENVSLHKVKSSEDVFRMELMILLDELKVKFSKIQVCTGLDCNDPNSLKVVLQDSELKLSLAGAPLSINSKLQVYYDKKINQTQVDVLKIKTNLDNEKYKPKLDISLEAKNIEIPDIIVEINGKKFPADTTRLKNEIVKNKSLVSSMLVNKISTFITTDLVRIINKLIDEQKISTNYGYDYESNSFLEKKSKSINIKNNINKIIPMPQDVLNPYNYNPKYKIINALPSTFETIVSNIHKMIHKMQFATILQDIDWITKESAVINFKPIIAINNEQIILNNELGHGRHKSILSKPSYKESSIDSNYDIAAVISEPIINSILNISNKLNIINESISEQLPGISINSEGVKFHIKNDQGGVPSIYVVLNLLIDLKKKSKLGYWIEKIFSNTNGKMYFPFELKMNPEIYYNINMKSYYLKLNVINPIHKDKNGDLELNNTFDYAPNNIPQLTGLVRNSLFSDLQDTLKPLLNEAEGINLSSLMKSKNITFKPKEFKIDSSGHFIIYSDVESIDIKPFLKGNMNVQK